MFDIKKDHLCIVFDDYRDGNTEEKETIWKDFCDTLWSIPLRRQVYTRKISFKVSDSLPEGELKEVFKKYCSLPYFTYQSKTQNKNSWYLLRQKLNNNYIFNCEARVCQKKDYFFELGIAKRLYINWVLGESLPALETEARIKASLSNADELYKKYAKQKMSLSWKQYRQLIDGFLFRCLENFIPLGEYEDKTKLPELNVDISEDNFVIGYIAKSITGYMRNYQKAYYGISRKNGRDKRQYKRCKDCGKMFLASNKANNRPRCDICTADAKRKYKREWKQRNKCRTVKSK